MPSPNLSEYLQRLYDKSRSEIEVGTAPQWLISSDGTAVLTHGSIGYCCYISPDGEAFMEEVWDHPDPLTAPIRINRSKRSHVAAIVLSLPNHPLLRELLPVQGPSSMSCGECAGEGWIARQAKNKRCAGSAKCAAAWAGHLRICSTIRFPVRKSGWGKLGAATRYFNAYACSRSPSRGERECGM